MPFSSVPTKKISRKRTVDPPNPLCLKGSVDVIAEDYQLARSPQRQDRNNSFPWSAGEKMRGASLPDLSLQRLTESFVTRNQDASSSCPVTLRRFSGQRLCVPLVSWQSMI